MTPLIRREVAATTGVTGATSFGHETAAGICAEVAPPTPTAGAVPLGGATKPRGFGAPVQHSDIHVSKLSAAPRNNIDRGAMYVAPSCVDRTLSFARCTNQRDHRDTCP